MEQTKKYLKKKIRKVRRMRRIAESVYRHRREYFNGIKYFWELLKNGRCLR